MDTKTAPRTRVASEPLILRDVNMAEAIRAKEANGSAFAPLSIASAIKRRGFYWISPEGISAFAEQGHRYYINIGEGEFRKAAREEFKASNKSIRLYISERAAILAYKNEGPLLLVIGGIFGPERLHVGVRFSPDALARPVLIKTELKEELRK